MAKRSKTKQRKNRQRKTGSAASFIKQVCWGAILLFLFFILLLFVYNAIYPEKPVDTSNTPEPRLIIDPNTYSLSHTRANTKTVRPMQEQIISHEGYTVSYNSTYKIANWVAYDLTPDRVESQVAKRSDRFTPDPAVKGRSATNHDYAHSGYDRGHLAPAADMKWSDKAMKESFYFSNITPQHPDFNRGIWKELEERGRLWALAYDTLYVITGPVFDANLGRLGQNAVGIPTMYYKVFCSLVNKEIKGIGFLLENKHYQHYSLKKMAVSIDSVETVAGLDFYYSLPLPMQEKLESVMDVDTWAFD